MSGNNNVAYQNKDVTAKYLEEHLENKTFAVYGVDAPKIVQVLPTNLPVIEANELRLDNLFLLEDGSLALVDYESSYSDKDKIKYLNYIIRTLKRNMGKEGVNRRIRMIVIYTADIEPRQTRADMDIGCLQFRIEEAFLTQLDSQAIEKGIREKLEQGEQLSAEEQMEFIILPLTYKGKVEKQRCIKRCFEMIKQLGNEGEQVFLLSGMLTFSDKVIDIEDSKKIREWIKMTKVAKLFEDEKLEYGRQQAKEAAKKAAIDKEVELVRRMISRGYTMSDIMEVATILTKDDIMDLMGEKHKISEA